MVIIVIKSMNPYKAFEFSFKIYLNSVLVLSPYILDKLYIYPFQICK